MYILEFIFKRIVPYATNKSALKSTSFVEAGSQVVNTTISRHGFCGYNCSLLNCSIGSFCYIADCLYR